MPGITVTPASPAAISALRERIEPRLKEINEQVDQRDVERLMKDDSYAALFVQWSKTEEDCNNLVLKCFKWRKEKKIYDVTEESLKDTLKKGLLFTRGRSVEGGRVVYLRSSMMEKKYKEDYIKLLLFWMERIQQREPGKLITFVLDTTNAGLMQNDMDYIKLIIECFTTYFPCMLQRIIIYNLPTLLNSIWKLVSKMLSAEQREATILCSKEEILKYIDVDNAFERMGGKDKFEYSYPPFPDDLE